MSVSTAKPFLLFLFLLWMLSIHTQAQLITNNGSAFGLLSNAGEQILPCKYSNVKPLTSNSLIYQYFSGEHFGFFNFNDSTLYPCVFTHIEKQRNDFIFHNDTTFGAIVNQKLPNGSYLSRFLSGPFDTLYFIDNYFLGIGLNDKYGVIKRFPLQEIVFPVHNELPFLWNEELEFYTQISEDSIALPIVDSDSILDQIVLPSKNTEVTNGLIIHGDQALKSIQFWRRANGEPLAKFTFESASTYFYSESYGFIQCQKFPSKETRNKNKTSWYNPYTGKLIATFTYPSKQYLFLDFTDYKQERSLEKPAKVYYYHVSMGQAIYTYIGEITGYEYVAYKKSIIIRKEHSGSDGTKPFWMPGK